MQGTFNVSYVSCLKFWKLMVALPEPGGPSTNTTSVFLLNDDIT